MSQVWIFHTWTFYSGTYCALHGQNTEGQNASQNCRGGDKMLAILWDREGKMPILSKHFIYDTENKLKTPLAEKSLCKNL